MHINGTVHGVRSVVVSCIDQCRRDSSAHSVVHDHQTCNYHC